MYTFESSISIYSNIQYNTYIKITELIRNLRSKKIKKTKLLVFLERREYLDHKVKLTAIMQ